MVDNSGKKKVLFLLEAFDKGGIEKVTLDIVNHLDPEKYDITVQTFWYGGHCQSQVNENIRVIPFFFKKYVRGIIRLIEYLPPRMLHSLFIHDKYDVEIAASDGGAAKVISGSTNKNSRKICWVHMDVVARGSELNEFRNADTARRIYERFDKIVCVSEACKEKFIEKFGNYNVSVVYNPMPTDEIRKKADESDPTAFHFSKSFRFVCIGRLVEPKGFDRLISVVKRFTNEGYNDFEIAIIGSGPDEDALSQQISQSDLDSVVHLIGFQANPYPYLKEASAFILSSRDEAFSLVVGESLIIGTPVIATDCCGVNEWLKDNTYGLMVENSENGIYCGMKRVLDDPIILSELHDRIKNDFHVKGMDQSVAEFERILNG